MYLARVDVTLSKDPFEDLKNMKLPPIYEPPKSSSVGFSVGDASRIVGGFTKIFRASKARGVKRQLENEGYDPVTINQVTQAILNGQDYDGILAVADEAKRARQKADEIRRNPPPIHGSAAWAEQSEMDNADLLHDALPTDGQGILLGQVAGKTLYWRGESHLLTIAPTRTGKGTMQIIPNLLQYKGSAVVLDPKGELATATADWRRENVGPVHIINPFELHPFGEATAAINPLDYVHNAQDALKLAEMVYPRTNDDRQKFFDNEAISFLAGAIEFTKRYAPPHRRNFGYIRDATSSHGEPMKRLITAMSNAVMPPSIRNAGLAVTSKNKEISIPRLIDSLNQHLRTWDTEGLRRATAQSDFDFKHLKEQPATVYLVLPFEELTTYSTFVQMIFAMALEAMTANPTQPDIPVLFVLDEFLALEADDRFVNALRTHASAGARLWFFLQDLATLEQKFPTTHRSFMQAEVVSFFGTDDHYTAGTISTALDDTTVAYDLPTSNPSINGGSASYSISENVQLAARPLLKPNEVIRELASIDTTQPRSSITFIRGCSPVIAEITPWFKQDIFTQRHSKK